MNGFDSTLSLRRERVIESRLENGLSWTTPRGNEVRASRFLAGGGIEEQHVVIGIEHDSPDPAKTLEAHWLAALKQSGIDPATTVFRRVFCSDVVNQRASLEKFASAYPGAFSLVGQAPAKGGRFAIWSHHMADSGEPLPGEGHGGCFTISRGAMRHAWLCGLSAPSDADAATQCRALLARHDEALSALGMTLDNDVIRTWWFIRDIDNDYQGFVEARKQAFIQHNLTPKTHYIASTGIAGAPASATARLSLDSHAIGGLEPDQVEFLAAPDHLGPTQNYGVTFERATAISYADRRHIFISGTASIDPSGDIVHPGDVLRQLDRALENVDALLASANGHLDQLAVLLVYLRDPADTTKVDAGLRSRFPGLPMIILHAPVCRPGWLVEVEGVAIVSAHNPLLPDF